MTSIPADIPGFWEDCEERLRLKGVEDPKVVIHGGYGKRNTGDDAILHVLIGRTLEHFQNARITVVCHGPENVAAWYPAVECVSFKSLGALKAILKADVYIIGGGGIINRINTYSGFSAFRIFDMKGKFLFIAAFLAKIFGAKTCFYAIGATSFPDPVVKFLAKSVMSRADTVSVRDRMSLQNLADAGVRGEIVHVLDPALSLEPAPQEEAVRMLREMGLAKKGDRTRPLVGLNLRYVRDPEVDNEHTLREAARLVEDLSCEMGCDVLFFPISQHPFKHFEDDLNFGRRLADTVTQAGGFYLLEEYVHPRMMMVLLGQMDFLILSRLHAIVLGTKMDVPVFTVSYDNKVTEFVKQIGRQDMLMDLSEFTAHAVCERITNQPEIAGVLHPGAADTT